MTVLEIFVRTFLKASAILIGVLWGFGLSTASWRPVREVAVPMTAQKLSSEALIANLGAADPALRARAACELRKLGEEAAAATGALVALLEDAAPVEADVCRRQWGRSANGRHHTTPGQEAAAALVAIGQRAAQALLAALERPSWVARRNAAWALGALDEPRAVATLIRLMEDSHPPVREQAAWALGVLSK